MPNSVRRLPVFSGENPTTSHSKFTCEYIQEFRNLDKYNKKYITDVEALNYFRTQHSLSKDDFELIIDVSNTDNNNNTLNEEEFAIAMHLIDIMNNKAMEDNGVSSYSALHNEEQKSMKGISSHDLKTHLGHHNTGRRCKELLDILYKEQSVWNSNRHVYTDPNILGDSLERLRDNEEELMDIFNELRRQVEECEKSTDITSQQISKELEELKSNPNTQINTNEMPPNPYKALFDNKSGDIKNTKDDANALRDRNIKQDNKATSADDQTNENSTLPYMTILKPFFAKEVNENELSEDEPENRFVPQPQKNVRDRHMGSEHRVEGISQTPNETINQSWSSRDHDYGPPTNEIQNQTKVSDIPNTLEKMKRTLNQVLPFTSDLTFGTAVSTNNNDSIITKGIIVSSVIGEFPGNFGKDTLESAALNNKNVNKTNSLDNTTRIYSSLKDTDTANTDGGLTGHVSVDHELLKVKSVIGQFPGDFGKEVLKEAESTSRSGIFDLNVPIHSGHISAFSQKPLDQDSPEKSGTILAQLDQDSYKVKSVISEFPGNFGKLQPISQDSNGDKRSGNEPKNTGFFSGYFSGAFNQIKSAVGVQQTDDLSAPNISGPITVSSVIGEFPGNFGKDTLESAALNNKNVNKTNSLDNTTRIYSSLKDTDTANTDGGLTGHVSVDHELLKVKSVIGQFPGDFGKEVLKEAESTSRSGIFDLNAPIHSGHISAFSQKPLDQDSPEKSGTILAQLDQDSYKVKSVISEFPGNFGKLQPISQDSNGDKRSGNEPKNTGFFSGYFYGAFNQIKSAVGIQQTDDLSAPNISGPITVSSVIGEFPGNFGKDVLKSAECNSRSNINLGTQQNENPTPFNSAITPAKVKYDGNKKASLTSKRKKRPHLKGYDRVLKMSNVSTIQEIGDINGIPAIYGLVHRGIHPVDSSDEDFSSESQASSDDEVSTGSEYNILDLFEINDAEAISKNDSTSNENMAIESTPGSKMDSTMSSISIENTNNSRNEKNSNNIDEKNSLLKESHSTGNVKIYDSPSLVGTLFNRQTGLNEHDTTSNSDASDAEDQEIRDRHNSLHIRSKASKDDEYIASDSFTSNAHHTDTNDLTPVQSSYSNSDPKSFSGIRENSIPTRIRCAITKDQALPSDVTPTSKDANIPIHGGNGKHGAIHLNNVLDEKSQFIKDNSDSVNKIDAILDNKPLQHSSNSKEDHLATEENMDNTSSPISSSRFSDETSSNSTLNPVEVPSDKLLDITVFDTGVFLDNSNRSVETKQSDTKNKQGFVVYTSSAGDKPLFNGNKKSLDYKNTVADMNDLSADERSIISSKNRPTFVEKSDKDATYNNTKNEDKVKEPYFNKTPQEADMTGNFSNNDANKNCSMESTISNQEYCIRGTSSEINDGIGLDSATSANLQNIKPKVSSQSNSTKPLNFVEANISSTENTILKNALVPESEKNEASKNTLTMNNDKTLPKTGPALPSTSNVTNKNMPTAAELANGNTGEPNKRSHECRKKLSEPKQPLQQANLNKMSEYYLVKPLPGDLNTKVTKKQPSTNVECPKILTSSWSPENAPFTDSPVNENRPNFTQDENDNLNTTDKVKESIHNVKHKIKSALKTDSKVNNLAPAKSLGPIHKELPPVSPSPKLYDPSINDVITARQEYRPSSRTSSRLNSPYIAKKANASPYINNIDIKKDASGKNPYVLDSVYMCMNKVGVDDTSIDVSSKPKKMNPFGIEISSPVSPNAQTHGSDGYHYDPNVEVSTPSTEDKRSSVRKRLSLSFGKVKSSIKDIRHRDSKHSPMHGDLENSYTPNIDNNMKGSIEVAPISQPNLSPRAKEKSPMISDMPNTYYSVIRTKNQDQIPDTQNEQFLDPQAKYQTEVNLIRKNSYDIHNRTLGVEATRRSEHMYDSSRQYDDKRSPQSNRNNAPLTIRDHVNTKTSTENIQSNVEATGDSTMSPSSIFQLDQNEKGPDPTSMAQSEVPESKIISSNVVTSENNDKDSFNSKKPVTGEDQNTHQREALMSKESLMDGSNKHSIGVPDIEEVNVTQAESSDVNLNDTCTQSNKADPLAPSTNDLSEPLKQHSHAPLSYTKNDTDRNESLNECEGSESVARFGETSISDQHLVKIKSSGSGR